MKFAVRDGQQSSVFIQEGNITETSKSATVLSHSVNRHVTNASKLEASVETFAKMKCGGRINTALGSKHTLNILDLYSSPIAAANKSKPTQVSVITTNASFSGGSGSDFPMV
jgi:hypothetical protein